MSSQLALVSFSPRESSYIIFPNIYVFINIDIQNQQEVQAWIFWLPGSKSGSYSILPTMHLYHLLASKQSDGVTHGTWQQLQSSGKVTFAVFKITRICVIHFIKANLQPHSSMASFHCPKAFDAVRYTVVIRLAEMCRKPVPHNF